MTGKFSGRVLKHDPLPRAPFSYKLKQIQVIWWRNLEDWEEKF